MKGQKLLTGILTALMLMGTAPAVLAEPYEVDAEEGFHNTTFSQAVLELVNEHRINARLEPLALSDDLNDSAALRAQEIAEVFDHTRPDGSSFDTAISGSYRMIGENIQAGASSPEEVVDAWMNSEGHRENIMNPDYREMGLGYYYADDGTYQHYWVQLFRR